MLHKMFDTLSASRRLESRGFTREQSEEIVEIVRDAQSDLFTKKDGEALREDLKNDMEKIREDVNHDMEKIRDNAKHDMETFRMEIQYDVGSFKKEVRGDLEKMEYRLDAKMQQMELRLTIRMAAIFTSVLAVACTLNKFFNIF